MDKLVPELRFKNHDTRWISHKLTDMAKVIDCKHRTPPYVEKGIPVVSPGSIKWGKLDLMTPKKRVTHEEYLSLMDHCNPRNGDLVFSRNQSLGVASIVYEENEFVLGQDTVLIQAENRNSFFIYYLLQTYDTQTLINKLSGGSTFFRINLKEIRSLQLHYPEALKEQQKIADFLSSVDNKIRLLTEKQSHLQRYKKGVMQKLFSQELRFKDENGVDFADWEEKELGDCLTIGSGRDYKHLKAGDIPVYGTGGHMLNVDEFLYDGESVCIGRKGTINKPMFLNGKFWTVDTLFYSHSYKNNLPKFLYYIFLQINWKKYNEASGVPSLSKKTIEKIKVEIPSPEEQLVITNFLSEIDKKIDSVSDQIELNKSFKKGLLQKMFV